MGGYPGLQVQLKYSMCLSSATVQPVVFWQTVSAWRSGENHSWITSCDQSQTNWSISPSSRLRRTVESCRCE